MRGYLVLSLLRHNGQHYAPNDFLEASVITEKESQRLIQLGVIKAVVKEDAVVVPTVNESTETNVLEKESVEETLDLNFNLDELKEGAREQGLIWKGNISKSNIITLLVEHDKTDYFLDQLED